MSSPNALCLWLALDRLTVAEHYAIWVVKSPYPAGHIHHDRRWAPTLSQAWQSWQAMFSLHSLTAGLPDLPAAAGEAAPYSSRLMQHLGISLWQWLWDGPVQSSFDHSYGIALGQHVPLRLRLELRDPALIDLPWEIMQPQVGRQAISLTQQVRFSRTTSDVDPLPPLELDAELKILLVLGQPHTVGADLQLAREAELLQQRLAPDLSPALDRAAHRQVDVLRQPTPAQLIQQMEQERYTVFFYAGHGTPAADGGRLFLNAESSLNGTELSQVLTRCRIKLAVFNACWGAQPDRVDQQPIPRSSLAEVLLHHGVPAVLGMRDAIADEEALSFIQVFAQSLAAREPVDAAVAIARQHLLTLYKFNQPAWTLPILYMHPDFDGDLLQTGPAITCLPGDIGINHPRAPQMAIRAVEAPDQVWPIAGGLMRIGRLADNDLVVSEPWVSSKHAEIFCRRVTEAAPASAYLRDFSRYGTFYLGAQGWQQLHRQEIPLLPGMQLRFGSTAGQRFEFVQQAAVSRGAPD
jgi:hypothetical protein